MTSRNEWGRSLFKGRIGEAIVESVLAEFGYRVYRSGQEEHRFPGQAERSGQRVFAPDLAVTDPRSQTTKYIEVKFRSSRPMSVILEASRLENIRRFYPGTILAFVSSYNGSVNCANVDDISPSSYRARNNRFCEFDLLTPDWKALWDFFPLVQPGARLQQLWDNLKSDLHNFAEGRISRSIERESFPDERQELEAYIKTYWTPNMKIYTKEYSDTKSLTLDQLWEEARDINAFRFAQDKWGDENVGTDWFSYTVSRLLGHRGEKYVTIDLNELRDALKPHPDLLKMFDSIRYLAAIEHDLVQRNAPTLSGILFRFFQSIPEGVGKAYLMPEHGSLEDALEIDFRTMFALMQKRNRLDANPG